MHHRTRTKIVATIGPACDSVTKLKQMIKAGMVVGRLNFSHGTHQSHALLISRIRRAAKECGVEVAIIQDLQGPRIRVGNLPDGGISIKKGQRIVFLPEGRLIPPKGVIGIPVQYKQLYKDVKKGDLILVEDGKLRFKVVSVKDMYIYAKAVLAGTVKPYKGINVPGVSLSAKVITAKDEKDLAFGKEQCVDYVALSFVKDGRDIKRVKHLLEGKAKVIAKIERAEALMNLNEIFIEADVVMVARGDLGLEIPVHEVPLWQKELVRRGLVAGKPVIVATQMLDSMIENLQPTRAEVSDVANAVFDHTDAIMLSGESANGLYPVEAVQMMTNIAMSAEASGYDDFACGQYLNNEDHNAVSLAVCSTSLHVNAKAIVVATRNGENVRLIARHRPELPIIALSPDEKVRRQLSLVWGVITKPISAWTTFKLVQREGIHHLKQLKVVKQGDKILVIASDSFRTFDDIRSIRVIEVE